MNLRRINISSNYQRYLLVLINTQRNSLQQGQLETWERMARGVCEHSQATGKEQYCMDRINTKEGCDRKTIFLGLRDAADEFEVDKISIHAMAVFAIYNHLAT
ncbi:unnamed protein product [Absidia cylindrospora]